jgi:threonine aldolase
MIDLRSDTLTVPTPTMRQAMANARVGDDVYAEDPTVNELQDRVASMFGKQAALFVPSGTMGNQISLAVHAASGSEVVADADAHIFHYENAAASVIARVQLLPIRSERGEMPIEEILRAIRPTAYYYPQTALIALESSHNRHGGTVPKLEWLRHVRALANNVGIPLHLDGARVWNAIAAGVGTAAEYGDLFDSLSVCLSKGLGAPMGSVVLGSRTFIEKARRWRKLLGGGMRQTGVMAAAGLTAIDEVRPLLPLDHRRAQHFAQRIAQHSAVHVDVSRVETNIVTFSVNNVADGDLVRHCEMLGLRIAPIKPGTLRAVWYHQIDDTITDQAAEILLNAVTTLVGTT